MKEEKKLKVVLFTGYACNNNCAFCIDADKRELPQKSTAELLREAARARNKGAYILEIIGGEATIRPDFCRVVAAAKKLGIPQVSCATNGRVFADPAAARRIVRSGIDALIFSVHGPTAKLHDALTRAPGSFAQLRRGLKNLRALGFNRISGNTTVVRQNMAALPDLARFYIRNGIRNVEYIFVDPNYGGDQWKARYVPLCHFKGCLDQISEINERELFLTEHWAPDFVNRDAIGSRAAVGRHKTARCRGCRLYPVCEGIWAEYLRVYGDAELKPVKKI
jgi:MoaA/NifB/PqqE/SkfB family radical SAM enzyme